MLRAIEIAKRGAGNVAPNPLVGCVLVHNNQIIGEGWHRNYGGPHAEVHAIQSVSDKSLLSQSELYVTLEPCSHFGKTPPCADLIVDSKIPKVHIACLDPNPLVAGKGMEKLKRAGIEVVLGIHHNEAYFMNRRFFTFMEKQRPYIHLKWAMTSDGFIDKLRSEGELGSFRISGDAARRISHRWRTEETAILIGSRTALVDNPELTARFWPGKSPICVLIDSSLRVPEDAKLFHQDRQTLVYNRLIEKTTTNAQFIKIEGDDLLPEVLKDLFERKIQSVLVEGGAQTLQSFIDQNCWDEISIFQSSQILANGLNAPIFQSKNAEIEMVGKDKLISYFKRMSL
jgi:diaminohydroxyphosphoribosylaminopyrimidine deaminase / 5-amino-6-(5-phosphoribosylamino)uracil reductase